MKVKPVPIPKSLANEQRKSIKPTKTKTRRGYGRKAKSKQKKGQTNIKLSVLGTNSNGVTNKLESLKEAINTFKPTIITLQETKVKKAGKIKLKGYQIFEKTRTLGGGGGLLTAVDQNLNPVLIKESQLQIIPKRPDQYDHLHDSTYTHPCS